MNSTHSLGTVYFGVTFHRNSEYEEFVTRCEDLQTTFSDPLFGCQWHLSNIDANSGTAGEDIGIGDVWDTYKGDGVRVTVVDDGLDDDHEDLTDNVDDSHSWSADQSGDIYNPSSSHGTSVAGIIAARDNALGVSGRRASGQVADPRSGRQSDHTKRRPRDSQKCRGHGRVQQQLGRGRQPGVLWGVLGVSHRPRNQDWVP